MKVEKTLDKAIRALDISTKAYYENKQGFVTRGEAEKLIKMLEGRGKKPVLSVRPGQTYGYKYYVEWDE